MNESSEKNLTEPQSEPVVAAETQAPTVLDVPETVPVAQTVVATTPFYKNKNITIALVLAVAILLGAAFYLYENNYKGGGTAAVVNGVRIYTNELNESYTLFEQSAAAQGADVTDEALKTQLRTQALEVLVNNALITTASKKAGFSVSDEVYESKYAELLTELGSEEVLNARMQEMGLSKERLERNIKERILADQYIESKTDIKNIDVSEEEILAFVKTLKESNETLPPLEEIKPQIKSQIISQKQQQLITDLITNLRAESTIDMRI